MSAILVRQIRYMKDGKLLEERPGVWENSGSVGRRQQGTVTRRGRDAVVRRSDVRPATGRVGPKRRCAGTDEKSV